MKVAVLGLGEAGAIYAEAFASAGRRTVGFDPAPAIPTPAGVTRAPSTAEAVADADLVLSLTTAAHAVSAARDAAPALREDALYIDLNAASPQVKAEVARTIGDAARVVDGAVIGSVVKFGAAVEVLLAGPAADAAAEALKAVGSAAEPIGDAVGAASGRKLLRSVFMKGLGALITESVDAGTAAGEEEWMRKQIADVLAGGSETLDRLDRGTRLHAVRRSRELDASIELLADLSVETPVSRGAADRHRYLARSAGDGAPELIDAFAEIPTAAIGDARDRLGFLSSRIRPVWAGARLAGRALTVQTRPGDNKALHRALAVARPGDVLVVDGGGDDSRALLGELIAERAVNRGVRGMVVDGAVRDVDELRELGFPVWAAAVSPAGPYKDGPGHIGRTISVGGAVCAPGDIVVADGDGVFIVPRLEAEQTLAAARLVLEDEAERLRTIRRERA
ncbi:NAD(P)-binding domain-containing protein [Nocardiopsis changdeensis]|uniref:Putative 4-hydroxy-4-methyl-2-oxoglutarate aldolase n=1 Tax=Nocardiopsis changdeensis TaxID=2831969 RepID=A0ABX8BE04_9ACTN|nr:MULTISPECIES: NAD(P)-binding domain-containing protein [Nocardiopsis]QUX20480.1 transferase [Nocardiopsis changdeensis]QYX36411.1 transferase [Nocardiopsis sp. MT53]